MTESDPSQTWPAVERRRNEQMDRQAVIQGKLDVALAEIQRLYGAATLTAEALTKALPRQEAEDRAIERSEQQKRLLIVVSFGHLLLMVVLLWVFSSLTSAWVRATVERDHEVISCLETMAEATKTANPRAAVTDCLTTAEE